MAGTLTAASNNLKELWEATAWQSGIQWQLLDIAQSTADEKSKWMKICIICGINKKD